MLAADARVERLCSVAEVAGGRTPATPRAIRCVEADNEAVVGVDARHQRHGDPAQLYQFPEIVGSDGDVRNFPGDGSPVADGDAGVRLGEAGESLMPSPTMRTVRPSFRRAATYSALSAGSTPARKSSTPSWAAMAAAGAGAVPGEHDSLFHAQSPQSGEHIFCLLPQGVGDTDHGGEHPSIAR